jgi:hypothetical protein
MREFGASALWGFFNNIDVNRTLKIAAVDVAAGGKTPVHLSAMASLRRRTARFAHASNALNPTLV